MPPGLTGLGLLATCARLRDESDVNWDLNRPTDAPLRRLFANANWAHLAAPTKFPESPWHPETVLPASAFTSPDGQHQIVNRIMDAILSSPAATAREILATFEWAVNEITDNVLQHADTPLGGLVQLSHYPNARRLEFVVADDLRAMEQTVPLNGTLAPSGSRMKPVRWDRDPPEGWRAPSWPT